MQCGDSMNRLGSSNLILTGFMGTGKTVVRSIYRKETSASHFMI